MDAAQNTQTQSVSNRKVGDWSFITHLLVRKCPAPPSPVSLDLRLLLVQRWPRVSGIRLRKNIKNERWTLRNATLNQNALFWITCWSIQTCLCVWIIKTCTVRPHLPSAPPSHRQGTWSEPAGPTGPPCFSANSSWSFATPWISRSPPCLRRVFSGGCTAHWIAARLWTDSSRRTISDFTKRV